MKKPLSGELLQNNLVKKKAHIRHPRNTANTSTFGLLDAKNTVKHAYFQAGSVSAASSLKSEQQENTVNYMVFACCARNYPPPPPAPLPTQIPKVARLPRRRKARRPRTTIENSVSTIPIESEILMEEILPHLQEGSKDP